MKVPFKQIVGAGLAAGLAFGAAAVVHAQAGNYPDKPIRIVVPYPPGGSTDAVARLVGEQMSNKLGQPVIVDNRPGASGVVAADSVLRQPADGYTLMLVVSSHALIDKTMKINFKPLEDFRGVGTAAYTEFALMGNPRTAEKDLQSAIAKIKANPESINWGMVGINGMGRMAVEQFAAAADVKLTPVPYQGSAPLVTGVSGGDIDYALDVVGTFVPHIQAGRTLGLAVSGSKRLPEIPDVPTFAEAGLPDYAFGMWYGFLARSETPEAVVNKLATTLKEVVEEPALQARLANLQLQPLVLSPAEFDARMAEDSKNFAVLVERAGITPQ